ncbi:MAG: hypothetical protein ACK5HS_00020 [Mycoplasmatales bacterium]
MSSGFNKTGIIPKRHAKIDYLQAKEIPLFGSNFTLNGDLITPTTDL